MEQEREVKDGSIRGVQIIDTHAHDPGRCYFDSCLFFVVAAAY